MKSIHPASFVDVRDIGAIFGADLSEKGICLLALPKQMSFLTISNENIAPSKRVKTVMMLQTVRADTVDEKDGIICLVSMFPYRVFLEKLLKIAYISDHHARNMKFF